MLNNADTGVIVTTDQQVSPEQREAILAALRERKRKAGTADRPLFLWNGAKVEKPSATSADLQFLENRRLNRLEIGAVFRVPATVMGFSEDANRAIAAQERLSFVEQTILPLCPELRLQRQRRCSDNSGIIAQCRRNDIEFFPKCLFTAGADRLPDVSK